MLGVEQHGRGGGVGDRQRIGIARAVIGAIQYVDQSVDHGLQGIGCQHRVNGICDGVDGQGYGISGLDGSSDGVGAVRRNVQAGCVTYALVSHGGGFDRIDRDAPVVCVADVEISAIPRQGCWSA